MSMPRIDALLLAQEGLDRVDRETIEARQLKKLNRLLSRERERGGFYRELPERLFSMADLPSLPFTTAPASRCSSTLLRSHIEPQRYVPSGTDTTPPPWDAAQSMAAWIARVSGVTPSPTAPKSFTDTFPAKALVAEIRDRSSNTLFI